MKRNAHALLATGYTEHLGAQELLLRKQASTADRLYVASKGLGAACRLARGKSVKQQTKEPRALLASIMDSERESAEKQQRARMLSFGIQLAEKRHLVRPHDKVRNELHLETGNQMRSMIGGLACKELRAQHGSYLGYLAELTTIGLVNYARDQSYLALPAPPHHDINAHGKTHLNYDVLFLGVDGQTPFTQELQIKGKCQSFCGNPRGAKKNELGKYASNIALISGHCDLGIEAQVSKGKYRLDIPKLLIASILDPESLPTSAHATLQNQSDQLVNTILTESTTTRAGRAT